MQTDEMETGSPPSTSEPLFLRDSSDEDEPKAQPIKALPKDNDFPTIARPQNQTAPNSQRRVKRDFARVDTFTDDSDDDIVILSTPEKPKASTSRPTKRKASPETAPATQIPARFADFEKGYIGSFYCSGLSLNKGKGYIATGAKVVVERNKTQAEKDQEKAYKDRNKIKAGGKSTTVIKNGKVIKGGGGPVKQATLSGFSSAKKSTSSASSKTVKKADTIVRFNNARGFEVGRLPAGDASFISPLLDPGMIELVGEVIDAPASLTVGCDILLNLKVYLTRKAFEEDVMVGAKGGTDDTAKAGTFWQQQGETEDEKRMRLRKAALDKLFSKWSRYAFFLCAWPGNSAGKSFPSDRMGLKPIRSSALTKAQKAKGKEMVNGEALAHFGQSGALAKSRSTSPDKSKVKSRSAGPSSVPSRAGSPTKKVKPAKGKQEDLDEESDVESGDEAELLNQSQLNELEDIYKRCVCNVLSRLGAVTHVCPLRSNHWSEPKRMTR